MTVPKTQVGITLDDGLTVQKVMAAAVIESVDLPPTRAVPADPSAADNDENIAENIAENGGESAFIEVPLESLAWARSGDKGDKAKHRGDGAQKSLYALDCQRPYRDIRARPLLALDDLRTARTVLPAGLTRSKFCFAQRAGRWRYREFTR